MNGGTCRCLEEENDFPEVFECAPTPVLAKIDRSLNSLNQCTSRFAWTGSVILQQKTILCFKQLQTDAIAITRKRQFSSSKQNCRSLDPNYRYQAYKFVSLNTCGFLLSLWHKVKFHHWKSARIEYLLVPVESFCTFTVVSCNRYCSSIFSMNVYNRIFDDFWWYMILSVAVVCSLTERRFDIIGKVFIKIGYLVCL